MMCKQLFHKATRSDALYVAENLQDDDRREIEGLGMDPTHAVVVSVLGSDHPITFYNPYTAMICGVAGVSRTDAHSGAVWMLTTPEVRRIPHLFFREAKKWLDQQTGYDMLHNIADPRNTMHMKLLHMLGFKRLSYVTVGPSNLTYVEFAKLMPCV
jgi:hypothetical protein